MNLYQRVMAMNPHIALLEKEHTERDAPATIARMTRAEFDAQLDRAPGSIVDWPLRGGRVGHPTLAPVCRCKQPIDDDGTCVRCGRNTPA